MREFDLRWQRAQFEGGWAGITWPVEYGGRGLSLTKQLIWFEEYGRAKAPPVGSCFVGVNHGGPTLIERGTDEQKRTHLPPILRGDVVWCQGFSEPGAGSDLAGIVTRGVLDGDELVVTGQKVWTSYANVADYQELLVRTGRGNRRHDGLTWIVCDMRSPGIDVRPLRTMAGNTEFCEVFYDDVRIPIANVVGELGGGLERGHVHAVVRTRHVLSRRAGPPRSRGRGARRARPRHARSTRPGPAARRRRRGYTSGGGAVRGLGPAGAHLPVDLWCSAAHRHARRRGPIVRLYHAELLQRVYSLGMELLGWQGLAVPAAEFDRSWCRNYLDSYASTIVGGTADIQRNIIGERVLGLPKDRV